MLGRAAPIKLCERLTCRQRANFATVIAGALLYRAVYMNSAVKFLVRLTEGPLPTRNAVFLTELPCPPGV